MDEEYIRATVQIEDTQPLPDDEAIQLLADEMVGKPVSFSPDGPLSGIHGTVVKVDIEDGEITITARINDPESIGRLNKRSN